MPTSAGLFAHTPPSTWQSSASSCTGAKNVGAADVAAATFQTGRPRPQRRSGEWSSLMTRVVPSTSSCAVMHTGVRRSFMTMSPNSHCRTRSRPARSYFGRRSLRMRRGRREDLAAVGRVEAQHLRRRTPGGEAEPDDAAGRCPGDEVHGFTSSRRTRASTAGWPPSPSSRLERADDEVEIPQELSLEPLEAVRMPLAGHGCPCRRRRTG